MRYWQYGDRQIDPGPIFGGRLGPAGWGGTAGRGSPCILGNLQIAALYRVFTPDIELFDGTIAENIARFSNVDEEKVF